MNINAVVAPIERVTVRRLASMVLLVALMLTTIPQRAEATHIGFTWQSSAECYQTFGGLYPYPQVKGFGTIFAPQYSSYTLVRELQEWNGQQWVTNQVMPWASLTGGGPFQVIYNVTKTFTAPNKIGYFRVKVWILSHNQWISWVSPYCSMIMN